MIWNHQTSLIIMLTSLKQGNIIKCCQYWPKNLNIKEQYDSIRVTLVDSKTNCMPFNQMETIHHLVLRTFSLSNDHQPEEGERICYQYHFEGWQDYGLPDDMKDFLDLIRIVEKHDHQLRQKSCLGPPVIHCR